MKVLRNFLVKNSTGLTKVSGAVYACLPVVIELDSSLSGLSRDACPPFAPAMQVKKPLQ